MKTNLRGILPLVFLATVGWAQPQVVGELNESIYVKSAAGINGQLYYSESNRLHFVRPDRGYSEEIFNFDANGSAENLKNVDETLYFTTTDQNNNASLWKTNVTFDSDIIEPNTVSLIQFNNTYTPISPLVDVAGIVYFGYQDKLYRSDGTESGTVLIKDLNTAIDQGFLRLSVIENKVFINFRKALGQCELWMSDGTVSGTSFIKSFLQIELLEGVDDVLYFVADDGATGKELWAVTAEGAVTRVTDINPGNASSFAADGNVFAVGDNALVFSTVSPAATWRLNAAITQLASVKASEIVFSNGTFYFIHENELYVTQDPGGAAQIKAFPEASKLSNLTTAAETVFFAVDGMQLWQSDANTPIRIYDYTPATPEPGGTINLIATGDRLYYFVGVTSREEWSGPLTLYLYNPSDVWIPSLQWVDAVTNEDVGYVENDAVIYVDQKVSIRADASLATNNVVFQVAGVSQRRERERPFSIAGDSNGNYTAWDVSAGTYQLTVTPYSSSGSKGTPATYTLRVVDVVQGCGEGSITREFWNNFSGSQITSVPFDRRPAGSENLNSFEGPTNAGTNYAARIKGYICPPETGDYTFWIASNDHSELWLSTDADPRNRIKIAYITGATNPRQWDKFQSQKSAPITLQAGTQYYIEALHKQGAGSDHIAVGWQRPNGEFERPIPGTRLSPFTGNHPPDARIISPVDGQVFTAPATILLEVETPDQDGFAAKVEFFAGSKLLDEYNHRFEWTNVPPGAYEIFARVTDDQGAVTISPSVNILVTGPCSASGTITREYWNGVAGSKVSDIPVTTPPSGETEIAIFEGPQNSGTHYGARIRGYICPPLSGEYTFWIASNDHSELWLSTDDDPLNKMRIASVTGATNVRQWNKFGTQKSSPVTLVEGKKYYIEALHKQGVGSDHIAVGWQWPDGTMERPIAGGHLSPYQENSTAASFMTYPVNETVNIDPLVINLQVAPVIGARRYTVEINPDNEFSDASIVVNSVEDYQTSFIVKNLEPATTYYVRVKTDISGYGPVKVFTTRNPIGLHRLWGLTTMGGNDDMGTIFSYSIDSGRFVKHYDQSLMQFDDYAYEERLRGTPIAGPDGTWYGQSDHEYSQNMFRMDKNGKVEWLSPLIFIHQGNLTLASNNNIYITTEPYLIGGGIGRYSIDDPGMTSTIRNFNQKEHGLDPSATIIEVGEYLYGTTVGGGINDGGVVYRIRHDGTGFEIIHYFSDVYGGRTPVCGLTDAGGFLYGTTAYGGAAQNMGTVFRMRYDGSDFVKLHDFDATDGRQPIGEVTVIDDVVFGMTSKGGVADQGTIYRVNTDGSGFMKLHDFSGLDGETPSGALSRDAHGNLYGMTTRGGAQNMGVIFSIRTDGTGFTKLYDFTPTSGGRPDGSLIIREDNFTPVMAAAPAVPERQDVMDISIHPNPTTDNFNVYVKTPGDEKIQVVVTDQYGQTVTSYEIANDTPAQIGSELKKGLYFLKVMQGREIVMKRVVKR